MDKNVKRSPLKNKTPLKRHTPLKAVASFKQIGIHTAKKIKPKKSHGLCGHGKTKEQELFLGRVLTLGCMACNKMGLVSATRLVIHHPRGRNKSSRGDTSEWFVICLCEFHHVVGAKSASKSFGPSVHSNKKLFVELVGSERWCVHETYRELNEQPIWFTNELWAEYLVLDDKQAQECWLIERENEMQGYRVHEDISVNLIIDLFHF